MSTLPANANPHHYQPERSIMNNMPTVNDNIRAPRRPLSTPLFARLPTEIWVEIASFLCDHCQDHSHHHRPSQELPQFFYKKAALSALAKICRWLRDAIQPVLHHQFPFANIYYYLHPRHRSVVDVTDRLYLFVRTLVARPDLATAVKSLKLRGYGYIMTYHEDLTHRPNMIACNDPTLQIIRAARRMGLTPPSESGCWIYESDRHHDGSYDMAEGLWTAFFVQFALCLSHKSRAIELFPDPRDNCIQLRDDLQLLATQNYTRNIEHLCIRGQHTHTWDWRSHDLDLRYHMDWLPAMPKLKSLQVQFALLNNPSPDPDGMQWDPQSLDNRQLPKGVAETDWGLRLGHLTRLDLVLGSVTEGQFAALLSASTNLEELTYISMPNNLIKSQWFRSDPDGTDVSPGKLTAILNDQCPHLRNTLRRLTLEHFPLAHGTYRGVYSSLQNLTALQEACLGANGLFLTASDYPSIPGPASTQQPAQPPPPLSHILPPNITSLDLVMAGHWKPRTAAAITHLIQLQATQSNNNNNNNPLLPHLTTIRIWSSLPFVPSPPLPHHPFVPAWWPAEHEQRERAREWAWDPQTEELARAAGVGFAVDPETAPARIMRQLRDSSPVEVGLARGLRLLPRL